MFNCVSLFNLVLNVLARDIQKIILNSMIFADDIVLIELWGQTLETKDFR